MIVRGAQANLSTENPSVWEAEADVSSSHESLQDRILELVGGNLQSVEKAIRTATRSRYPIVDKLSSTASSMGGKRLRPTLVLLASQVCGRTDVTLRQTSDLESIATAVELVHAASLVHDDVMDDATERRHQPTIGALVGSHQAVLLGDFLFTRAYAIAASCRGGFAARQIAKAATQLCEGELRQQASAGCWDLSIRDYRSIIRQKTAALCGVSCLLGAWAVRGDSAQARALSRFGMALGEAFQLFDDWLDYFGSEAVGKTLGTDLQQLKPTLPLLRLLSQLSEEARRKMIARLEHSDTSIANDVRLAMEQTDASDYTLKAARRCVQSAESALDSFPNSSAKQCLLDIARFSVARMA